MKKWILLLVLLLVVTGVAGAIPNPSAWYCTLQGYEYEIRTDEQGNQYGVCIFPDGSECSAWAYYCKCEPNACFPGNFTCHWPCKEMRCKEAGEPVLVSECCEGLDEIYPPHIFDANCNKLQWVGWLFLCSDCGNGICECWESKCNCPEDCAQPSIIYVDDDANGLNDGSNWADAFNDLQDALTVASSGDEIRVAQGIYKPDQGAGITPGDREATFQLINGVALKGGYAGFGQPDPNARDIELYETILTGDLNGNDVDVNDPRDLLEEPTRAENSYHVVTGSRTEPNAVLDGFTVTGGNANGWYAHNYGGAGMYNYMGSPTLTNCKFSWNSAICDGGGMSNYSSSPIVTNCKFTGNLAGSEAPLSGGGGMYNWNSSPTLTGCTFSGNSGRYGGGMHNSGSSPTLTNCTLSGNHAQPGGGISILIPPGGHKQGGVVLTNCILWGNRDSSGVDEQAQIWGSADVNYSCIQGLTGDLGGTDNIGDDPRFVRLGYWNDNGTPADPSDDYWVDGDYHLKSQSSRWDPISQTWVQDDVTGLCIDAGDPLSPIGFEPFPNGGIINMGAYGGTTEASKSYFGKHPCETIVAGDINGDCEVNFLDFRLMALHWCEDNNP